MSTDFEFYQGATSENTAPKITVRKGGQLVLTSGAVEMLGEDVEGVTLSNLGHGELYSTGPAPRWFRVSLSVESRGRDGHSPAARDVGPQAVPGPHRRLGMPGRV